MSSRIENYLGFPSGLSGADLAHRAVMQARRFGVEILSAQRAVGLNAEGLSRKVMLQDGTGVPCRALIIATGVSYRTLQTIGIEKFAGAGIYYGAAMSEGESVRGQDVVIVGGANSAGQAAMYFSGFASGVIMLVRGKSIANTMSQYLVEQIGATPNIKVRTETELIEALGKDRLECLKIKSVKDEKEKTIRASALFIFIGAVPHTAWLGDQIARDKDGFILSGPDISNGRDHKKGHVSDREPLLLETSLPGVFVAGDVRHGSVKRVASAVGEGAMAVMLVHKFLRTV